MAWKDTPARLMGCLGYQERHWFWAWSVLSAVMLGFVSRSLPMVIPSVAEASLAPGEWFKFEAGDSGLASSHVVLALHVASVFIWTACGTCQFIPKVRMEFPVCHRVSGRIYFLASVVAVVTGLMLEPKSFGGDFSVRSAMWVLGLLFIAYGALGLLRAVQRRIQEHKRWMLRMYSVGISVGFSRVVIPLAGVNIVPSLNLWGTMSCGQIRYELRDDASLLQEYFPACFNDDTSDDLMVALRAGLDTWANVILSLRMAFSVGLWLGLLVNTFAVELYIHHQVPEVLPTTTHVSAEEAGTDCSGPTSITAAWPA